MSAPHREAFVRRHRRAAEIRAAGAARHGGRLIDLARSEPLSAHLEAHPDPTTAWEISRRYLPPAGAKAVRERIAAQLALELGLPLEAEHVAVTAGGNAALTAALATVAGPGDEVILPLPHYPPSPSQVELSGARPVLVALDPACPRLDPGILATAVTERTAAVLLTNPANPTGVFYGSEELRALDRVLPPRVAWVVDEAYAELVYDGARCGAVPELWAGKRQWLAMRTASKTIGRPGLRVAFLLGPADPIARAGAILACTAGAAGSFGQVALAPGLAASAGHDDSAVYAERLELALEALAATELSPLRPQGTYYLWVRGPADAPSIGTLDAVAELCSSQAVFVSPGELYGDPGGVRLSLSCPPAAIETGIERLAGSRQMAESA